MPEAAGNWFEIEYAYSSNLLSTGYTTSTQKADEVNQNDQLVREGWKVHPYTVAGGTEIVREYIPHADGGFLQEESEFTTKGCE
jgi:hypothetical protein